MAKQQASEFDVELAYEILRQIRWSTQTIKQRFQHISSSAASTLCL